MPVLNDGLLVKTAMTLAELHRKIQTGEDSTRQFKVDVRNGESLAAEMVAFANSEGGVLFIGVADDGSVPGLSAQDVARINQLISNAASQWVRSPLTVQTENVALENGRIVIVLRVPKGADKPYFDNRIEIISPGHLPNNLTVEKIRTGSSNIRNPILVSYVAKGLLPYHGLGSGIKRALTLWPKIDFCDDRDGCLFVATVHRQTTVVDAPLIASLSAPLTNLQTQLLVLLQSDQGVSYEQLAGT